MTNQWTDNVDDQWVGDNDQQWYDEGWIVYVQGTANYYLITTDSPEFFGTEETGSYYNTDDATHYLESTP